jgi:hypothetical protein
LALPHGWQVLGPSRPLVLPDARVVVVSGEKGFPDADFTLSEPRNDRNGRLMTTRAAVCQEQTLGPLLAAIDPRDAPIGRFGVRGRYTTTGIFADSVRVARPNLPSRGTMAR